MTSSQIVYNLFYKYGCGIVLKPLTLYAHLLSMGKRNKVVKLTDKKVKYIIRAKTKNYSTKNIARDMKLSKSTVKMKIQKENVG